MAKPMDILELVSFIRDAKTSVQKAATLSQLKITKDAELLAKKNAIKEFTGRGGRPLSGALLNSIYSGFEKTPGSTIPTGFVGVRNIPYGRIHEYGSGGLPGGVIKPVKAKKLWLPIYKVAGRMTPREFINLMKGDSNKYHIFDKMAGRWDGGFISIGNTKQKRWTPLFFLADKVKMPARPYVTPAIEESVKRFPLFFDKYLGEELQRGK